MSRIKTKSPVSKEQIDALVSKLQTKKSAVADGLVLANLIRVCFECALKRNELIDLRIEDVSDGGVIKNVIRVGDKEYKITNSAKNILQSHLHLLKSRHYQLYQFRPLFPSKRGHKYSEKNLVNHLKKYFESEINNLTLENIRQAGICHYYDFVSQNKMKTDDECLEYTKDFSRFESLRHTKNVLEDKIQPAGKKPNRFIDYLNEIEILCLKAQNNGRPINNTEYKRLHKRIINDKKLKDYEKNALVNDLKIELEKSTR